MTDAKSDTPRTDAQLVRAGRTGEVIAATRHCGHETYVSSDFARTLDGIYGLSEPTYPGKG